MLPRLADAARGMPLCSQAAQARHDALSLRVFGSLGASAWTWEEPHLLLRALLSEALPMIHRSGTASPAAACLAIRLPAGSLYGCLEAFI